MKNYYAYLPHDELPNIRILLQNNLVHFYKQRTEGNSSLELHNQIEATISNIKHIDALLLDNIQDIELVNDIYFVLYDKIACLLAIFLLGMFILFILS